MEILLYYLALVHRYADMLNWPIGFLGYCRCPPYCKRHFGTYIYTYLLALEPHGMNRRPSAISIGGTGVH